MITGPAAPLPAVRVRRAAVWILGGALFLAFAAYCASRSIDFDVYYRAAAQVVAGGRDIYPPEVYAGTPMPGHGFRYAPLFAFLFAPLALVPVRVGAFLFVLLKAAALVYIGRVIGRSAGLERRAAALVGWSALAVAGYLVEEFRFGQFHLLSVALMVMAFDGAVRERVAGPAAALALAIAAKLTPVVLLAYFAWRRRFAIVAATVAGIATALMLPAVFVGLRANTRLLCGFVKYAVEKVDENPDNYSLRGLLLTLHLPPAAVTGLWIGGVAAGVLIVVLLLRRAPATPMARWLELSIVLTGMLLASPDTQRFYFTSLIVPVMTLMALRWRDGARHVAAAANVGIGATVTAGTILPLVVGSRAHAVAYEALEPYFFATLILLVALIVVRRRMPEGGCPEPDPAARKVGGLNQ